MEITDILNCFLNVLIFINILLLGIFFFTGLWLIAKIAVGCSIVAFVISIMVFILG